MSEGLSRRELLAWGAAATALSRVPAFADEPPIDRAGEPPAALGPAFASIDAFVARHLKEEGLPGLTHALASREGALRTAAYGFRDVKTREPLRTGDLFEIGSISKSFVGLCCLQLRDEGPARPRPPRARVPALAAGRGRARADHAAPPAHPQLGPPPARGSPSP